MRFSRSLLLALPALALAEEQVPLFDKLKGYLNKATAAVSSAIPAVSPLDAGAAKVAEHVVSPLTLENWQSVLTPSGSAIQSEGPEHWLVYITGGNVTCYGLCANATKAWNASVAQLSVKPKHPNFAVLDCEANGVLCNSWSVGAPSIYYFLVPQPLADQSKPATEAHYIPLNRTSVTANDITELYTKEEYKKTPAYEGYFHPFDGPLQQFGVAVPLGYVIFYMAKMPSWLPMIAISFFSRTFMSKRVQAQQNQRRAAPAQ